MVTLKGETKQILLVDMTRQSHEVIVLPKHIRQLYPGGRALGLYLYGSLSLNPAVIDPMGTENLFVITLGLTTGVGDGGSYTIVTKSPQTERLCVDSSQSSFGVALRSAGWDGVVIKGKHPSHGIMEISSEGVSFQTAKSIWKDGRAALLEKLNDQLVVDNVSCGMIGIGTAGALGVPVSSLITEGDSFGHGGMGAVLGAKNLKAIIAKGGTYQITPCNESSFDELVSDMKGRIEKDRTTPIFGKPKEQTPEDRIKRIRPTIHYNELSTDRKWNSASFYKFVEQHVSGDMLLGFGTAIDNLQFFHIETWKDDLIDLGLDIRSMGHIIAWAMKANELDIRPSYLKFGSYSDVKKAIEYVGGQRGIAKERNLGLGLRWLVDKFKDTQEIPSVYGGDLPAIDLPWKRDLLGWTSSATVGALRLIYTLRMDGILLDETLSEETLQNFERIIVLLDLLGLDHATIEPLFMRVQGLRRFFSSLEKIPHHLEKHPVTTLLADYGSSILGYEISPKDLIDIADRTLVLEQVINVPMQVAEEGDPERYEGKDYQELLGFKQGVPKETQLRNLGFHVPWMDEEL